MDKEDFSEKEIWKDIEYSNHQVSNFGNIKNKGTLTKIDSRGRFGKLKSKILKNRLSENKYLITFNNYLIHRLVAIYFIPNPLNLPEVNHKDGDKLNNHVSNLEWCTKSENIQHAFNTGLNKGAIGELSGNCKLTEKEVIKIRELYSLGTYNQYELASQYNIKQQQVSRIVNNKRWKHL